MYISKAETHNTHTHTHTHTHTLIYVYMYMYVLGHIVIQVGFCMITHVVCVCVCLCTSQFMNEFGNSLASIKGSSIGQLCERENKRKNSTFFPCKSYIVWFLMMSSQTALAYLAAGDGRMAKTLKVAQR